MPRQEVAHTAPARILAIDDEEAVRVYYQRLLGEEGYKVQTAASAEEGLRLLEQEPYDLILLDLKMPGMDGLEFMQRLRGLMRRPEVLIVSAHSTVQNTVEVVKLGASDVVQKPYLSGELLPGIERILARHREPIIPYIQANFAAIKSREEVAWHFKISPETVSNRIRRYTGQSFHDFLESHRVREAQRLLVETELEAKEIAARTGFRSYKTFERAFQRLTGHTPSQYRQEIRTQR